MYNLDRYDTRILKTLCANSRTSYRDIASDAKLSKDAVRSRVQTYIDENIINGFITRIDQDMFCDGVLNGMVKTNDVDTALTYLADHPRINWAADLLGDHNIAFTYFAADLPEARKTIQKELNKAFIKSYQLNLYTKEHKFNRAGLFADHETKTTTKPATSTIDDLDATILTELATNSRANYAEIAHANNVSGPTISKRVKQLRRANIIDGFTVALRPYRYGYETYFVGVQNPTITNERINDVKAMPAVTFLTETIGYYDCLFRITVNDQDDLKAKMQRIQERLDYASLDLHRVLNEPKEVFVPREPLTEAEQH